MIYGAYIEDFGLQYVYGCAPYSLDDLYDILERKPRDGEPGGDPTQPMFLDLTNVNLLNQTEADFRRFILRPRAFDDPARQNDVCSLWAMSAGSG